MVTTHLRRIEFEHQHVRIRRTVKASPLFDTSHWRSVFDVTLTLKQAVEANSGIWVRLDEHQSRTAFRHFVKRLNRAVYGKAASRHQKRLRLIAVLEKDLSGRWHFHAAIEPPAHFSPEQFDEEVRRCWAKTHWAYREVMVRDNADPGWLKYMFKQRQKSGLEHWSDCIDWDTFHNPIAGA